MYRTWVAVACAAGAIAPAVVAEFLAAREYERTLREETAITARYDDDIRAARERSVYQQQLAFEVAAGRLPLAEAAEMLHEANQDRPLWDDELERVYPELPGQRARYARVLVATLPDGTAAGRVRAEFDALVGGGQ